MAVGGGGEVEVFNGEAPSARLGVVNCGEAVTRGFVGREEIEMGVFGELVFEESAEGFGDVDFFGAGVFDTSDGGNHMVKPFCGSKSSSKW